MSILFEAWRRARGETDEVGRALGAPRGGHPSHGPVLPWVLCVALAAVAGGLGVYAWRFAGPRTAAAPDRPARRVSAPAVATVGPAADGGTGSRAGAIAGAGGAAVHSPQHAGASASAAVSAPGARSTVRVAGAGSAPAAKGGSAQVAGVQSSDAGNASSDGARAALPDFKVTVHVWNPKPAARFVVVGGKVRHVGDTLVPGVRLVSITRSGEVVRFHGHRLELSGP